MPPELVRFLKFVTADLKESEGDFQDELIKQLQKTIHNIKTDREMGERYMIFEEMLREEKQEGKIEATREAILELLKTLGNLPDRLCNRIENLEELVDLKFLFKLAAKASSIESFEKEADKYLQTKEKQQENR